MSLLDCFVFFFSSRRRHTRCALVTGVQTCALPILAKPCNGSADLAKAVPNELAARTIAVTIRRAIIGILPSLLEAVADRLRNALNQVGRATRLPPIFPEKWPMSNANNCQTFPPDNF